MAKKSAVEELLSHEDGFVTVTMDADVFRWLYDMLAQKHGAQRYAGWIPHYQDQIARGYDSFRLAAGDEPIDITPEGSKPVGSVKRNGSVPKVEHSDDDDAGYSHSDPPPKATKKRVIRRVAKK